MSMRRRHGPGSDAQHEAGDRQGRQRLVGAEKIMARQRRDRQVERSGGASHRLGGAEHDGIAPRQTIAIVGCGRANGGLDINLPHHSRAH
jgi:hypothetical protein